MGWQCYVILLSNLVCTIFSNQQKEEDTIQEFIVPLSRYITVHDIVNQFPGSWIEREYTIGPRCHLAKGKIPKELIPKTYRDSPVRILSNSSRGEIKLIPNIWLPYMQVFETNQKVSNKEAREFWTNGKSAYNFETNEKLAHNFMTNDKTAHLVGTECCYKQNTGERYWGLTRISHPEKPNYPGSSYKFSDTGKCVNVFVVDSGVNIYHQTFGGRATVGFIAKELFEKEGSADLLGHGTHVAGLAAGQ